MFGQKKKTDVADPDVAEIEMSFEGSEEEQPSSGDRDDRNDVADRDFGWEEGDPADRRRDPLRKP
jgi:hypothetical protein